jgi:Domain of unknown function (DUF4335)
MESPNLKARTYTAPTCELTVSDRGLHQPNFDASGAKIRQLQHPVDTFTLHLEQHDLGEQDRVILQGQPQQLAQLQQVVSKYVAELVAKFPLQNNDDQVALEPVILPLGEIAATTEIDTVPVSSVNDRLYPSDASALNSGLMNNLPGLRNNLAETPAEPTEATGVSKFFGLWNKADQDRAARTAAAKQTSPSVHSPAPTIPYLTASPRSVDRQLHHQLHLGDLATPTSGAVLSLSAIQLFDLSTVLDEYTTATQANHQPKPATLSRANIPGANAVASDPAAVSLSRLPNLPKIPAAAANTQVYRRTRRSSSSFMSAIPWAAAAAVAVGLPFFLLDSKPNPLKDATSKVKMPDLAGVKKTIGTAFSPEQVDKPTPISAGTPNPALPTPWQAQPVQPPKSVDKPVDPSLQPTQTTTKIGLAPLPDSIVGKPGQDRRLGTTSGLNDMSGILSGIAPNPLSSSQSPAITDSQAGLPGTNPQPQPISKSPVTAPRQDLPVTAKPATTRSPKPATTKAGSGSIAKQPAALPSELPATGGINAPIPQLPLNPAPVEPKISKTQNSNKTPKQKFTPTEIAKTPKSTVVKQNGIDAAPQPTIEPFTPVPTNPNIVNPEPQSGGDLIEPQNPALIPNRPLQSNVGGTSGTDPNDTPSLQEAKRYFQDKWKADPNQSNPLQYVLQISGKSGIVRSVAPQGEAATTYLQQSKLIKPGQKLVSPAAAGTSDQKIRVLLQPDGNVDTFLEP